MERCEGLNIYKEITGFRYIILLTHIKLVLQNMENFLGSVSLGLKVCLVLAVIPRISRTYFIMAKRTKALMGWLTMDRRDPYCIQSTVEGNLKLHRPPFKGVLGRISLPWPDSYLVKKD